MSVTDDHQLHLTPNLFADGAISDGRTYAVSLIDANKNHIPTDTELFVQGTLLDLRFDNSSTCTRYLASGQADIQHGEISPANYCRYSVLMTEKFPKGGDPWPAIGLVCNVSPSELKEVARLYKYGDEVQAHGTYAASLDFNVASSPGSGYGLPMLEDCTFADPTTDVVRLKPPASEDAPNNSDEKMAERLYNTMDKNYRDHRYVDPRGSSALQPPAPIERRPPGSIPDSGSTY
jgi:hypothetical protein